MQLITVNEQSCIKCGACANVCPRRIITLKEGYPQAVAPESCIACGHCVAVCPTAALDNAKAPLSAQPEIPETMPLDAATAEGFMRFRRSTRVYKSTPVPQEKLLQLVNIAHFAPTAQNAQGISFVVVNDRKVIEQAIKTIIADFESDSALSERMAGYLALCRASDRDIIFRGAPCLILATADVNNARARESAIFSLTYLELFAPALGLGTCWSGIGEACALRPNSPLLELFKIQSGKKIVGVVMAGYPQYRYKRLTNRNPLEVSFYE